MNQITPRFSGAQQFDLAFRRAQQYADERNEAKRKRIAQQYWRERLIEFAEVEARKGGPRRK